MALQISIPQTSVASPHEKPFTQYHVVLQLPLRREEVRKRYTDFVKLNQDLTTQTGSAPPGSLPAKNWFSRTVNNDSLTESRRKALEQYVQAIIAAKDGRWRSSKAWRAFMNLPEGVSTIDTRGQLKPAPAMDAGHWLDMHRELKTTMQTARQQLKLKEVATSIQQQHTASADAKASLVKAAATIQQLDAGLIGIDNGLGDGEIRRRKDLITAARKEVQGLEGLLKSTKAVQRPVVNEVAKEELWKGKTRGRVLGGPVQETERTRELDNNGVLQLQQQMMQEQDQDVMLLGQTVAKLKDMGIMMNEELEIQNEMLRVVEEDTDRVQGKIDVGRSRIKKIR